jgi:hypothetical protein
MERSNAGVVERGEDAGFLLETRKPLRLARQLLGQSLARDLTVQLRVACAVLLAAVRKRGDLTGLSTVSG